MSPKAGGQDAPVARFPRASGDEPRRSEDIERDTQFSPRERG